MKTFKKNYLIVTGGTGGHVIPAQNLAKYLINKNIKCSLIVDKRGSKYINCFTGEFYLINSSNLTGNLFKKIIGVIHLLFGFIKSFYIVLKLKPTTVISFGSYASFFPMLSSLILKPFFGTKIFIHEQNSILGRTNSFFLHFSNKLFLNFDILSKINKKYQYKTFIVGSPENNYKYSQVQNIKLNNNFSILILGGSQGSEFISNFATKLIKMIDYEKVIHVNFIMQCPSQMIKRISKDLNKIRSKIIIKEYYNNIDEILANTSLAISRSGAGSISDLITHKIPSILIPLPTSKDNHQFYNALIMSKHELAIILDQNNIELERAKKYIYEIYEDKNKINEIYKRFDKINIKNSNSLIYNLINNEKQN